MPPPPPELSDDLFGEVFLRLPSDDPACLLRASLACKRWRRVLADPAFRRRHRELHQTPAVVGFLRITKLDRFYSDFVPNNPASGRPAARDLPGRLVLDCRHGRVLFSAPSPLLGTKLNYDLVVWDPLTNEQRCPPRLSPPLTDVCGRHFEAVVLCSAAVEGCDHSTCHGGPFRVAFIWSHGVVMYARVYSSETDSWSEAISVQQTTPNPLSLHVGSSRRNTLVGNTLYLNCCSYALEYQLGAEHLSIIEWPPQLLVPKSKTSAFFVMPMKDGGLGCTNIVQDESSLHLQLWSWEAVSESDEVARWTRGRAIDLEEVLPNGALPSRRWKSDGHRWAMSAQLLGFAEGTDFIFVHTWARDHRRPVYMVQLSSGRAKKVLDDQCISVIPYTSFCIPVIDSSSVTEGPGDNASVTDDSSATEGPGDDASLA